MEIKRFPIAGPFEFIAPQFEDARGYFTETFHLAKLQAEGMVETNWVQDNQSCSRQARTLRGMHFQSPPLAQAKIVRVLSGAIYDVVVDLRPDSPSFGKWLGVELTSRKMNQLYVPAGFAHGFLTLVANVVASYKVSNFYSHAHDRSLNWADADVGISWPLAPGELPILSDKDAAAPPLRELMKGLKASG
jgi:dTDP-4-dehydrorhamnose 3,5-epimerase